MSDHATTPDWPAKRFIAALKNRGLVERAEAFCASWKDGYIAQDADGWVHIYNCPIRLAHKGWAYRQEAHGNSARLISKLAAPANWQVQAIPVSWLRTPPGALSVDQLCFLQSLKNASTVQKLKAFLTSWENNSWIAMNSDGRICFYNHRPHQSSRSWTGNYEGVDTWIELGFFESPDLDWEKCLLKLSSLQESPQFVVTIEINNADRMDCWL